jgi:hypothetical protein
MKVTFIKSALFLLLSSIFCSLLSSDVSVAEKEPKLPPTMAEDDLQTKQGLRWGGQKWPYSQIVEIQDSLVGSPVGRVIIDRHGIDKSDNGVLFNVPFSAPAPGKSVFVSLWGSKIEGCYAEMIVQVAPRQPIELETIVPTLLELGINGQIVQLVPQKSQPQVGSFDYTYLVDETQQSAIWYMSRQIFFMDSATANLLASAPAEDLKVRVNFGSNSLIIPIGAETVRGWKQAYQFNPTCQSPTGTTPTEETESPF